MNLPPSRRHKTAGYVDESAVYSLSDSTLRCYNKLLLLQHHSILTFFAEVNLRRSHIPLRTQPLSQIVQMPLKGSLFWSIPFFLFCNTVVVAWLWRMAINSEGDCLKGAGAFFKLLRNTISRSISVQCMIVTLFKLSIVPFKI